MGSETRNVLTCLILMFPQKHLRSISDRLHPTGDLAIVVDRHSSVPVACPTSVRKGAIILSTVSRPKNRVHLRTSGDPKEALNKAVCALYVYAAHILVSCDIHCFDTHTRYFNIPDLPTCILFSGMRFIYVCTHQFLLRAVSIYPLVWATMPPPRRWLPPDCLAV